MSTHLPPLPRDIGTVNWIGLWTLYQREVYRFLKVYTQTIAAPVVTTLLFYAVFALALGGVVRMAGSVPFLVFLGPGLIVMAMAQNAFANTSSSMVISKVQGNIVDVLMPPLSPLEMAVAYVGGGVTRGMFVGVVTGIAIWVFVPLGIHSPGYILFHGLMASMMLAQLGMIGGIWSEKFDHIAAFTNFVVTPLTFLSGTFYSVDRLPPTFWWLAHFNPFFYMIDGFRYGFFGASDVAPGLSLGIVAVSFVAVAGLCLILLKSGYKLRT
jgi:ABC-2 type transport system permease protein